MAVEVTPPFDAVGAGAQVDDADIGARLDDGGGIGLGAAGEDVDEVAAASHLAAELAHVDVHAAGLAVAQGRQRRRVRADDGYSLHSYSLPLF